MAEENALFPREEAQGFHLTEAQRRYNELFGAPGFTPGPSRNPSTPGMRIIDAPNDRTDLLGVKRPGTRSR